MTAQNLGALARRKQYQMLLLKISNGATLKPSEMRMLRELEAEIEAQNETNQTETSGPKLFTSASDVARYASVSRQAVVVAVSRGRLTQDRDGSFSRTSVDSWLAKRKPKNDSSGINDRERLDKAKADIAEMERDELKTKLIRKAAADRAFTERAYEVSRGLLEMGRRLSLAIAAKFKVPARQVQSMIDAASRELAEQYARPIEIATGK